MAKTMLEKMEDKAQKRIVELGITEAQRARDYSSGYCDGYLEGLLDATNRAADIVLKNAAERLRRKKGAILDVEIRPMGKAETR